MGLTAEEFVNDYLVDRKLVGLTRAAKVTSLLDAWTRQEFTGPHSRQVEGLRRRNTDLRAALEALFIVITSVDTVYESETGHTIEQDFTEELDQARVALSKAMKGESKQNVQVD